VKTLVLLRHAKSDWAANKPDRERPLTARGRRQAPEAGQWLAAHLPDIDLAVVSTAERAQETWRLANAAFDREIEQCNESEAYTFNSYPLLGLVADLSESKQTVVVVGHNPAFEDLITHLTGQYVAMPTSCLAVIRGDNAWPSLLSSAELVAHGRPPQ
jgi:phosphohistidine phosphatase